MTDKVINEDYWGQYDYLSDYYDFLTARKRWVKKRYTSYIYHPDMVQTRQMRVVQVIVYTEDDVFYGYEDATRGFTQYDELQETYCQFYACRKPWKQSSHEHAIAQGRQLGYEVKI